MLAAAGHVTGHDQFVVIGSQAILGSHEAPPDRLLVSLEVDIYPLLESGATDQNAVDKIDGALGDGIAVSSGVRVLRPRRRPRDS